jgi:hypothetical protein
MELWPLAWGRWILGVHEAVALSLTQQSSSVLEDGVREWQMAAKRGAEADSRSRAKEHVGWQWRCSTRKRRGRLASQQRQTPEDKGATLVGSHGWCRNQARPKTGGVVVTKGGHGLKQVACGALEGYRVGVELGTVYTGDPVLLHWAGLSPTSKQFSKYSNVQYATGTSRTPKISKLSMLVDKLRRNNFAFGNGFKFQMD